MIESPMSPDINFPNRLKSKKFNYSKKGKNKNIHIPKNQFKMKMRKF